MAVITSPDEIVKHMPSACEGCRYYQMCKGTACIAEKRHVINAVVTVNVTEYQALELPICMLHGDTRRGTFPSDVKAAVQYGENLQALSVALNTVGAVSIKRTHEILSGVFNIPIATGDISNMVKRCADSLSETVGKIKDKMVGSALGHFDETGTRVDKKLWWVHDASNCEYTYLDISPKRGTVGMEQCVVLPALKGIAMHDCRKWKNVKDKAVEKGKDSLSYYHYHKFEKKYDKLIEQAREENPISGHPDFIFE